MQRRSKSGVGVINIYYMFILTRKKKQLMALESESDNTSAWNAPDKYTPLEKSHLFFGVGVFLCSFLLIYTSLQAAA